LFSHQTTAHKFVSVLSINEPEFTKTMEDKIHLNCFYSM